MKKIGLIGGTSWVSTIDYYKYINEGVNAKLSNGQFAQCIIYSFNYGDIVHYNKMQNFEVIYKMVEDAANKLIKAGAEAIVLCANTLHMHADRLSSAIAVPLIHIAVATGKTIQSHNMSTVGLIGTKFTMEQTFYSDQLLKFGIQTLIPIEEDRIFINDTLHDELGSGILNSSTKERYLSIIQSLYDRGAEGVILGCTEIPLLINQTDTNIPVFDTTKIHSDEIVSFSLNDK